MIKLNLHLEEIAKKLGRAFNKSESERIQATREMIETYNVFGKRRHATTDASKIAIKFIMDEMERVIDGEIKFINQIFNEAISKKRVSKKAS